MIPVPEPDQIGAQLKALRLRQGLRQREVAERAGMAACQVSEIERGRYLPTMATAGRISAALGHRIALIPLEDA